MHSSNDLFQRNLFFIITFLVPVLLLVLSSCVTVNQPPVSIAPSSTHTTNPTSQSLPSTSPSTSPSSLTQEIHYTMPPGAVQKSTVAYSKYLQQGTPVTMTVELTGTYQKTDWSYDWDIQILGPGGESIEQWQGNWVNSNFHPLDFTASYAGTYMVRVGHLSSYPKNLTIKVEPAGWGYAGN